MIRFVICAVSGFVMNSHRRRRGPFRTRTTNGWTRARSKLPSPLALLPVQHFEWRSTLLSLTDDATPRSIVGCVNFPPPLLCWTTIIPSHFGGRLRDEYQRALSLLTWRTLHRGYCGVRGTEVQLFDGGSSGKGGERVQSERWEWIPLANAA